MDLNSPISSIPGVGTILASKLAKLGIHTVFDFLYHLPFRYEDRSNSSTLAYCQPGEVVTVLVNLDSIKNEYTKSGKVVQKAYVSDSTGIMPVIWFNRPFLVRTLRPGSQIALSGKIESFRGERTFVSPDYEPISPQTNQEQLHTGRLVPIYPETAGITSKWLRTKIKYLIDILNLQELFPSHYLPEPIQALSQREALYNVHFPTSLSQVPTARHRLAFDELLLLQLSSLLRKTAWNQIRLSHSLTINQSAVAQFIGGLPFTLTPSQNTVLREILQDLTRSVPMNRLLQGDVGSGKTVIAAIAAYITYLNGLSTTFLAPTTILAEQHYHTLTTLLTPYGIQVSLLTGQSKPKLFHHSQIIVATHALLTTHLNLNPVGLVVIDEQHRFGVTQRSLATTTGVSSGLPHVLTMTATPIPRTVALTLHADLDLSTLTELPSGRLPIKTWIVGEHKRQASYGWITNQLQSQKSQGFWVCPFIEPSESVTSVRSAKAEFEKLQIVFPTLKLGLLHGKLKSSEKSSIISKFRSHDFDILVTTPVVEVGIDIPNATLMIIEDADRFGLSQLHQLRGRVGRGVKPSYCLLFSKASTPRLKAMERHHQGSELAEIDFSLRGPGDIFGTSQHGIPQFKIATYADSDLISAAKTTSQLLFHELNTLPLLRSLVKNDKINFIQPN